MVAAAFASGATSDEIEEVARTMRFKDVARWTLSRMGLAGSERMVMFLRRLLRVYTFDEMRIPLAVIATDLGTGKPVVFRGSGDVCLPIRASCSYPGLFLPIREGNRYLVDGAMSMEVPAAPLRQMGAAKVISVGVPMQTDATDPGNMFSVVNRCFQILQWRTEREWRRQSDIVITPPVADMSWDCFLSARKLIEAGERAAESAMPRILRWLESTRQMAGAPLNAPAAAS
jgi:NTE family protein